MSTARNLYRSLSVGTAVIALASGIPVFAQTSPAQPDSAASESSIDEIVVTARRETERAQDVPISLTAFSQETIRAKGINSATDLQNFTPSLTVIGDVRRNQETYTIRGLGGSGGAGTGSGPGVVGYFAEVPTTARLSGHLKTFISASRNGGLRRRPCGLRRQSG